MDLWQAYEELRAAGLSRHHGLVAPSIRLVPRIGHPLPPHPRPPGSRPCRQCRRTEATEFSSPGSHVAVAAGREFALALTADGAVEAWGANAHGELGDGTTRHAPRPRRIEGMEARIRAVAAGNQHSLALTDDGSVLSWGWNFHGALGTGSRENRRRPGPVIGLPGPVVAIAAGAYHSLALLEDGAVMAWGGGWGSPLQIGDGAGKTRDAPVTVVGLARIVAIFAGEHNFALDKEGRAWGWGPNRTGELGDGTTTDRPTAVRVKGLPRTPAALVAGFSHSVALIDGRVWAWGNNFNHQLGDGADRERASPAPVEGLSGRIDAVAASGYTLALTEDGSVWGCGLNYHGQLGNGAVEPRAELQPVPNIGGSVSAVAAGSHQAVVLRRDGALVGWGGPYPPSESDQDPDLAPGASKLGGRPDLAPGAAWPSFEGKPQVFVGQVNLADAALPADERIVPDSGLLSFFVAQEWRGGFDAADRGSFAVLFTEHLSDLERLEPPAALDDAAQLPAVGLDAALEASFASPDSLSARVMRIDEEAHGAYTEIVEELGEDEAPTHRLLGYPDLVQNDMQLECEAVTAGLDLAAGVTAQTLRNAAEWRLLFQADSDYGAGMEWGDVGKLYYWIRAGDLAERRFDRIWGLHQSH
ncbi:MAG: DUF1963 domain-containing protein [Actinomycetota bacterium]|nr:DUF1963 domain-containing protein [Actinomycetota bacterium]